MNPATGVHVFAAPGEMLPGEESLRDIFRRGGFEIMERVDDAPSSAVPPHCAFASKQIAALFAADIMPPAGAAFNPRVFLVHKFLRRLRRAGHIAVSDCVRADALAAALLSDARRKDMRARLVALAAEYETENAVKVLSQNVYNKVELVRLEGGCPGVCKTFRRWQRACAAREVAAREGLAGMPEISPILDAEECRIVIPHYRAEYQWDETRLAPFPAARAAAAIRILREIRERGWAMIDCHPGNFIFTGDGIKIVDLEFARRQPRAASFEESWDMTDTPQNILDEMPMAPQHSYRRVWLDAVGLEYASLARPEGMLWRQYARRILFSRRRIHRNLRRRAVAARQKRFPVSGGWMRLPMRKRFA